MKTLAPCMLCQAELGHPSFEPLVEDYFDDGIAYTTCAAGHRSAHILQSPKFEILLESGANALLAAHTFEACASFSTALERFREFYTEILALRRGLDSEGFRALFRPMSNQSERQLGAFMALYGLEFVEPYRPDDEISKFRNSVIHKGYIPARQEAETFCARVYEEIRRLFEEARRHYQEELQQVTLELVRRRNSKVEHGITRATSSGCWFFSISQGTAVKPFTQALEDYRTACAEFSEALPAMRELHDQVERSRRKR